MTNADLLKKRKIVQVLDAISIEGGLVTPEMLSKITRLKASSQNDTDYQIEKGLLLRDEIGRYWKIAKAIWSEFQPAQNGNSEASVRFITKLLEKCLGFTEIVKVDPIEVDDRYFPIGHEALNGRVPIVIGPTEVGLDSPRVEEAPSERRRSLFGLAQEYLNATDEALWGICSNGQVLRVLRDNSSLTRPAWIEANLERIFSEDLYAEFTALWLLFHVSRFGKAEDAVSECPLEEWRTISVEEGVRARDYLRFGVEEALEILGQGFLSHPANKELQEALRSGELSVSAYFQELLRLVYRVIFVLTVEERDLIHPTGTIEKTRRIYADGYSLRLLRDRAIRRHTFDTHWDAWSQVQIVFHSLNKGNSTLGLPALGGLFSKDQCRFVDKAKIINKDFLRAIFHLTWIREDSGLARINWRDMGPEELGSVYEGLLELVPQITEAGRTFSFVRGEQARGNARKLSGSYYTPDSLVQSLLDSALEPVIEEAINRSQDNPIEALLALSIVDCACGSGHFLLAAARRVSTHIVRLSSEDGTSTIDYRKALRMVISRCIFGVDKNRLAIELARMAFWLETMSPNEPLSFIDHHLVVGDALVGMMDLSTLREGIPKEAYKAISGDDKRICKTLAERNRTSLRSTHQKADNQISFELKGSSVIKELEKLDHLPDDSPDAISKKHDAWIAFQNSSDNQLGAIKLACDIYLAAFLAQKNQNTAHLIPTSKELFQVLAGGSIADGMREFVTTTCAEAQTLHWKLQFGHVFSRGGFDVVLGNPPWERIKLQEQEFFAERSPEVANAQNQAARREMIQELKEADHGTPERHLFEEFERVKHVADSISVFVHTKSRYPLTGIGDVNTYALFAETAVSLVSKEGRVGVIVPSGIATDDSTKKFFSYICEQRKLANLLIFDNQKKIFPSVHPDTPFTLLTLASGMDNPCYAAYLLSIEDLKDKRRMYSLSSEEIRIINPNTKTSPLFRSKADAELTKKIYSRIPVLWNETREDGNPWELKFATMFHMSSDSGLFKTLDRKAELEDPVPLYEAKMIHIYDHRWATYDAAAGKFRDVSEEEKADPSFQLTPRYWVERAEVENRLLDKCWPHPWLIGWRDITNATNERTVISSVIPKVGVGNNLPIFFTNAGQSPVLSFLLIGNLSSLVFDFVSRHKVGGTHLNFFLIKQLPTIAPTQYSEDNIDFVSRRVLSLLTITGEIETYLSELSVTRVADLEKRKSVQAELDAYYAALYGLERDELRYILDPAEVMGADYPSETFRVLKDREIRQFGEYRTQRLVLEAWDRMEKSGDLPNPVESIS
jgi:hypothetical protein